MIRAVLRRSWAAVGIAAFGAVPGCGGGGGSGAATKAADVQVTMSWAARSRAIQAPSSALSAAITLTGADPSGGDFTFTVDRATDPAAYTQTYTSTNGARPGKWTCTVRFYARSGGSGGVVGTAQATVNLRSDGTGIGTIATTGTIAYVDLLPNQTVNAGQQTDLVVSARDATVVDRPAGRWSSR